MVRVVRAPTAKVTRNPEFAPLERRPGEGNMAWSRRAGLVMQGAHPRGWTRVALIGGADNLAFRLRVAQSHLRNDMLPSFWSDALLLYVGRDGISEARAAHVPLIQPGGDHFATCVNGVVVRPFADFDDPARYPNVALVAMPVAQRLIRKRLSAFMASRSTIDSLEHVLRWLAFAWGVARTGNPLHDNYGLPSACMLETLFAAEGIDLTPGLESRSSCPEAIWAAALHWHEYFTSGEGKEGQAPFGRFVNAHKYAILGHEGSAPTDGPFGKKTRPRPAAPRRGK